MPEPRCKRASRPGQPAIRLAMALSLALAAQGCGDDAAGASADAGRDAGPMKTVDAGHDAGAAIDSSLPPLDAALDATVDASHDDAGHDEDAGPPEMTLADTGLYSDFASETLAPGVQAFEPQFVLWSDGATKKRYLYLPPGTKIDTSDMDAWVFPVGTKAWKEFTRGGVRVETRLLEKTDQGWFMMAFLWNATQTKAVAAPDGKNDANGTKHDVPSSNACHTCHDGMPDRLLGVSAIQLSHSKPGLNLTALKSADRFTTNPAGDFVVPGTQADRDALGALHANCGHCHNPNGEGWDRASGMQLRLLTGSLGSVSATPAYASTVGVETTSTAVPGAAMRVVKGMPGMSALYVRLGTMRPIAKGALAMPPLATELNDHDTERVVADWITALP